MVRSLENGVSLPPFLVKCYEMVSDESTNDLISWTESNDSFIIWDESKFAAQLLPTYFKHGNFASFVRQLNIYGFRKIDTDRWQFANEAFIKGQKHLLKNISRRKQFQNVAQKNPVKQEDVAPSPPPSNEEDKRAALWKEVENLKNGKEALMQELKNLRQHQENSQNKLIMLRQQLNGMEKNQQQMLSFIVMVMQSPEFMAQFFQTMENGCRMAENGSSKLSEVTEDCELAPTDSTIVAYQPLEDGISIAPKTLETTNHDDDLMDFDFSSEEMHDLMVNLDFIMSPKDERLPFSFENLELSLDSADNLFTPDASVNYRMLEQLLLPNPSTEEKQVSEFQDEPIDDSETQAEATNLSQLQVVSKDENLQGLTQKLEDL